MPFPKIAYGTPRKLPKAKNLKGRVVVLDVAFASKAGGASFQKTTLPFIEGLGDRLAMWIDHHDHERHADYADDPRFVLHTKAEHGACPEIVTPELVERAGRIDTICCHVDFDGLCSAAKWIRGGVEPYPGADADAHAIDTRLGTPSERAMVLDRALRGNPRDDAMKGMMIRYLAEGGTDQEQWRVAAVMDRLETTGAAWLGLTLTCARCHDHKYDDISQDEYYQLFAFYNNGDETNFPLPSSKAALGDYEKTKAIHDEKISALEKNLKELAASRKNDQNRWEKETKSRLLAIKKPVTHHPVKLSLPPKQDC